jgi:hypothetical protein
MATFIQLTRAVATGASTPVVVNVDQIVHVVEIDEADLGNVTSIVLSNGQINVREGITRIMALLTHRD